MRKFLALVVTVVLLAPALAVCAGAASPAPKKAQHDCCPEEETASLPAGGASMHDACCDMSTEAAHRAATPGAVATIAGPHADAQAAALAWQCAPRVITRTASREPAPHASDHVPRHVLLSVFLI